MCLRVCVCVCAPEARSVIVPVAESIVSALKCLCTQRSVDPSLNALKIVFTTKAFAHFPIITYRECITSRAISSTERNKDVLSFHFYLSSVLFVVFVINFVSVTHAHIPTDSNIRTLYKLYSLLTSFPYFKHQSYRLPPLLA